MAIASTCTYWRTVALNDASMWTCLDGDSGSTYWSLALKRSQSMPLYMAFLASETRSDISWATPMIKDNLQRLRAITIESRNGTFPIAVHPNAPLLEHLTLYYRSGNFAMLPAHNTPSLRSLKLTRCYIPCLYDTSKCLTNISIDFQTLYQTIDIYSDIRAIFQGLANLEYVSLQLPCGVAPPPTGHGVNSIGTKRFLMKQLRYASFVTSAILIHDVLRSIELPSLDILQVVAHAAKANDDPSIIRTLFSAECLPRSLFDDLVTLSAERTPRTMCMDCTPSPLHTESSHSDHHTRSKLSVTALVSSDSKAVDALFDDILTSFSQLMPRLLDFVFLLDFDDVAGLYNRAAQSIGDTSKGVASIIASHRDISALRLDINGNQATSFVHELMESINNDSAPEPLPSLRYCSVQLLTVPEETTADFLNVMQFFLSSPGLHRLAIRNTSFHMAAEAIEGFVQDLRNLDMSKMRAYDCDIVYQVDVGDGGVTAKRKSLRRLLRQGKHKLEASLAS